MSDLLPIATYHLNIEPYSPTPAIDVATPVTVRITMAAIDPEPLDKDATPSTIRLIRRNLNVEDDEDDILGGDYDEEDMDDEDDEDEDEEEEEEEKEEGKEESEDDEESGEDDEDEDDGEFEEFVLATLSPKSQFQQTLDIVISPEEEVQFIVTGSYRVSLSGNFVKHPFDGVNMYDDESDDECCAHDEDEYDEDYDLTPDEEDLLDMEDASDVEGKIQELIDKDNAKGKRKVIEELADDEEEEKEESKPAAKKAKKQEKKEKKVEFKKNLEEGPSKKADPKDQKKEQPKKEQPKKEQPKKEQKQPEHKTKVLEGGIIIEDRVVGTGKAAKKGAKVGMRYIGKLKNGKVFDKNTSGKPFVFKLGQGDVIKGWDIGVAGMAVGGERRIVIPAPYAYGKQSLPGIPANSELTFDVKLVSMK